MEENHGSTTNADIVVSITEMTKTYIGTVGKLKRDLAAARQMLSDSLENDESYNKVAGEIKELTKKKKQIKDALLKNPQLLELSQKVKDMSTELKEAKRALSEYLQEFARLTGAKEIEDEDGKLNQIIYEAKLISSASNKK